MHYIGSLYFQSVKINCSSFSIKKSTHYFSKTRGKIWRKVTHNALGKYWLFKHRISVFDQKCHIAPSIRPSLVTKIWKSASLVGQDFIFTVHTYSKFKFQHFNFYYRALRHAYVKEIYYINSIQCDLYF